MNIPVKKISDKEMELLAEARIINLMNAVASKHKCTITKDGSIYCFHGQPDDVDACANELCEILEVVPEKPGQEVIDQWPTLK